MPIALVLDLVRQRCRALLRHIPATRLAGIAVEAVASGSCPVSCGGGHPHPWTYRGICRRIASVFKGHPGYETIQQIHGVGPVLGATFTAELGDVTRFRTAKHVCSWAGLTPRHRESDTKVHRGSITKQGPPLVRWAAIEAVSKNHGDDPIKGLYRRVGERRGKNKGRVAAARKVLTLVYYGLRDGEIRSLAPPEAA